MFSSKDIFLKSSGGGGYQISRSVRLRSSASAYFNRTPASATNRKTWTWSGWVKRGALGSQAPLFFADAGGNTNCQISFLSDNTLRLFQQVTGTDTFYLITTSVYRDPSAWYHIVVAVDTTQATNTNRLKMYVNGVQTTNTSTLYPSQNFDGTVNNNVSHYTGTILGGPAYFDGYLTEINFIDGQALTPSSFGSTNAVTGVWQPKSYTGTYGTNGFYLNFSDNSSNTATTIGKDYSGNGNNWTPNNISVTAGVTYDSMIDVPTPYADGGNGRGNYCVLNRLDADTSAVSTSITNGNLTASGTTYGATVYTCSMQIPQTGKWYWEVVYSTITTTIALGVRSSSTGSTDIQYYSNGNKNVGGSVTSYGSSWTTGDIIGCAVDRDAGTVTWYKNNVSQGAINIPTNSAIFDIAFNVLSPYGSTTFNANFGQRPFSYTPPTGFKTLNTFNLPAPTISNGASYMAATTYTGNGTTQSITNGGNNSLGITFQPDFVWLKKRSGVENHQVFDSVRGVNNALYPNLTNAAGSDPGVTAFNSDGFSLGGTNNTNAATYIGWQWKAGGTSSSNTSGSITSTVSANPTVGFSIVTYTGNGSAGATCGHGLGATPALVIWKNRNDVDVWVVYSWILGVSQYMVLNTTAASAVYSNLFNGISSTLLPLNNASAGINASGKNYVAYCFSEVAGYSRIWYYTGNGSADGPFVFCGFRPRFIMIKRTDSAGNNWVILDTSRDTYNAAGLYLYPNLSAAEDDYRASTGPVDILSNGFKQRSTLTNVNASGGTYIFMAVAENPFKLSLAR